MGSKFCNLNIHGTDVAAIESVCSDNIVRAISQSWVTVVGGNIDWGVTRKEAKRISKALPYHVLSTEYYDDDFVEFAVYRNGKMVARHVPAGYEGFARSLGKSKLWAEELGLSQEAEKALQVAFRETNPEASLRLIECIFNCPIWVDADSIDSAHAPTQEYLAEYLRRKSAEKKIKNRTRLVLLDEVVGDFGWHLTYPAVRDEHGDGVRSFWNIENGTLREMFKIAIPKKPEGAPCDELNDLCEGSFLLAFDHLSEGKSVGTYEKIAYVFSDEGEILGTFHNDRFILSHGAFLDRDRIILEGVCWNVRTHEKEWDLGIEQAVYGICSPCRLDNGRLAIVYDASLNPHSSYLMSFLPDGSDRIVLELPHFRHWSAPIAYKDYFLLACENLLTCYSPSLEELWSVDLGKDVGQLGKRFLDNEAKVLYIFTYDRLIAFDLEKRQIKAVRNIAYGEGCYLNDVLPGVGAIIGPGYSSIQVWNSELTPISRHKIKGRIGKIIHRDGKVYVLTIVDEDSTFRKTDYGWESIIIKPSYICLYELKP